MCKTFHNSTVSSINTNYLYITKYILLDKSTILLYRVQMSKGALWPYSQSGKQGFRPPQKPETKLRL